MRNVVLASVVLSALVLTGCGSADGGGDGANGITVAGIVLGEDGLPRALTPVALLPRAPVATGPDGAFRFEGVSTPYRVAVFDPVAPRVTVYEGLTLANPKLVLYDEHRDHRAERSGAVEGGVGFPTPSGVRTWLAVRGPYGLRQDSSASSVNGFYDTAGLVPQGWAGPVAVEGTLIAYQYTHSGNFVPLDYTGWGTLNQTLVSGQDQGPFFVPMMDPDTTSISGSYVPAPGTSFEHALLTVDLGPRTHLDLRADDVASAGTFQLRAPVVPGATYTAEVKTEAAGGVFSIARATNLAAGATGVELNPMPLHPILEPPPGATNVGYDTEFTFGASPLGLHMLTVSTGFGGTDLDPTFHIVTTATTVRIPDLSAYGLGLPPLEAYSWFVEAWGPYDSVDDMARVGSLWAPQTVAYRTKMITRSMTTAP